MTATATWRRRAAGDRRGRCATGTSGRSAGQGEGRGHDRGPEVRRRDHGRAAEARRPWSFAEDIVPILTAPAATPAAATAGPTARTGSTSRSSATTPRGITGADPRRRRPAALADRPRAEPLLLARRPGAIPHGGGPRIVAGLATEYRTLLALDRGRGARDAREVARGARPTSPSSPATSASTSPGPQQLRVVARYADGHRRDVTRLADYRVNDDSAARRRRPTGKASPAPPRRGRPRRPLPVAGRHAPGWRRSINPDLDFDFAALPRRELHRRGAVQAAGVAARSRPARRRATPRSCAGSRST